MKYIKRLSKRTIYKISINFVILVLYYIWFQLFYNIVEKSHIWPYKSPTQAINSILLNFFPILITYLFNFIIVFNFNIPIGKKTYLKILKDILLSFIALSLLNYFLLTVVSLIIPEYKKVNWGGTIFYNTLLLLGMEVAYFFNSNIRQIKETTKAHEQLVRYKYESLKVQMNPHFLFNTLNILYSLVEINVGASQKFIMSLSKVYRYILDKQNEETVTVNNEIAFISEYINILKLRYNNNLEINILNNVSSVHYIIPYTLQILVENIVKHNKISDCYPLEASIICEEEGIKVSNPINRKESGQHRHLGLEYIKKNYCIFGRDIDIQDDGYFFTVFIPYIK